MRKRPGVLNVLRVIAVGVSLSAAAAGISSALSNENDEANCDWGIWQTLIRVRGRSDSSRLLRRCAKLTFPLKE